MFLKLAVTPTHNFKIETMIKFENKTEKLKNNSHNFSDLSTETNKIMSDIINEIKSKLGSISSEHIAEVILNGKIDEIKISVKTDTTESANIIEKLVKGHNW